MGSAVLAEMRENIEETVLPDNSIKYSVKYVTYNDLKYTFLPNLSNYNEAAMQAKNNFKKLIKVKGGLESIQEMMTHGQTDHHFRILDASETKKVLSQPHCFSFQTTAFKEASKSTRICHVSNPSKVGVKSGTSLNMCQKVPGNLSNPPDWTLAAFTLYSHPLSADIQSAYRKILVHPEHRRYQLLCFYDFSKTDWENNPLVCEQVGLPFGCVQSGTYLELILEKVSKTTKIPLAALIMLFFRQVDNFLYSFSTREALHEIGF